MKTDEKDLSQWLMSNVHCPFFKREQVREIVLQEHMDNIYSQIADSFTSTRPFVMLRDTHPISDFSEVALRTRGLLDGLQERECKHTGLKPLRYSNPYWALRIAGRKTHSLVFSAIYRPDHPRSSVGYADYCMLLLPDSAFDQFRQDGTIPERLKFNTRQIYHQRERPYNPAVSELILESMKVVKPVDPLGAAFPWWKVQKRVAEIGR